MSKVHRLLMIFVMEKDVAGDHFSKGTICRNVLENYLKETLYS